MKTEDITAFPTKHYDNRTGDMNGYEPGMTLRDYFAAKALSGCFSNMQYLKNAGIGAKDIDKPTSELIANSCYEMADAMLKERLKNPNN